MSSFFNTNLKYIRTQKGISQKKLAEKIGVDQSTVSYWEKGMDITIDNAVKVALALNIDIPEFLGKDLTKDKLNEEELKEYNFGDIKVTISKNGKITDKDILETNQFLMQEKIKNEAEK